MFSPRQLFTFAAVAALILLADPGLPTYAAGCGLAVAGILLRIWGCGHLRKNQELVTSGPYAHVKHPLYLGTFLIATGGILAAGSPRVPGLLIWVLGGPAFLLLFFGVYLPRKTRTESARLRERFGERFPEYDRAVPAFVPSLRPYPKAERRPWSWANLRENHELEMDALIVGLFALMLLGRGDLAAG